MSIVSNFDIKAGKEVLANYNYSLSRYLQSEKIYINWKIYFVGLQTGIEKHGSSIFGTFFSGPRRRFTRGFKGKSVIPEFMLK